MLRNIYGDFIGGRGAVGLLILRVVAGSALMLHGLPKIQNPTGWMGPKAPVPSFLQALAALSEFGGGLALIFGLLTPLAMLGVICTMAFAAWTHIAKGGPFVGKGGYEPALVYFAMALMFLLVGPGRLSLDALLFGRRSVSSARKSRV